MEKLYLLMLGAFLLIALFFLFVGLRTDKIDRKNNIESLLLMKGAFWGGVIGFAAGFSFTWLYNCVAGQMPDQLNPYVREFPMMRSILVGWVGCVLGSVIGIVSAKRRQKRGITK